MLGLGAPAVRLHRKRRRRGDVLGAVVVQRQKIHVLHAWLAVPALDLVQEQPEELARHVGKPGGEVLAGGLEKGVVLGQRDHRAGVAGVDALVGPDVGVQDVLDAAHHGHRPDAVGLDVPDHVAAQEHRRGLVEGDVEVDLVAELLHHELDVALVGLNGSLALPADQAVAGVLVGPGRRHEVMQHDDGRHPAAFDALEQLVAVGHLGGVELALDRLEPGPLEAGAKRVEAQRLGPVQILVHVATEVDALAARLDLTVGLQKRPVHRGGHAVVLEPRERDAPQEVRTAHRRGGAIVDLGDRGRGGQEADGQGEGPKELHGIRPAFRVGLPVHHATSGACLSLAEFTVPLGHAARSARGPRLVIGNPLAGGYSRLRDGLRPVAAARAADRHRRLEPWPSPGTRRR
ncbi:hypothetical protein D3C72_927610 [compost metagenome]